MSEQVFKQCYVCFCGWDTDDLSRTCVPNEFLDLIPDELFHGMDYCPQCRDHLNEGHIALIEGDVTPETYAKLKEHAEGNLARGAPHDMHYTGSYAWVRGDGLERIFAMMADLIGIPPELRVPPHAFERIRADGRACIPPVAFSALETLKSLGSIMRRVRGVEDEDEDEDGGIP